MAPVQCDCLIRLVRGQRLLEVGSIGGDDLRIQPQRLGLEKHVRAYRPPEVVDELLQRMPG